MKCYGMAEIPASYPAGLLDSLIRAGSKALPKVTSKILPKASGGTSKILSTSGKYVGRSIDPVPVTRYIPDLVHSGAKFGAEIPTVVKPTTTIEALGGKITGIHKSSFNEAVANIQKAFKSPTAVELHPKLAGLTDDAALTALRQRSVQITDRSILLSPEAISKSDTLLRRPEVAARLQGTANASKELSESLLKTLSEQGRTMTAGERASVSAAMKDMDIAIKRFSQEPAFDPAILSKTMRSETEIAIKKLGDPVGDALRHAEDPTSLLARRGDDYGTILTREAFESTRPALAGETAAVDRLIIDETGRPLMQRTIMSGDRATYNVYRELTETEARSFVRQTGRELGGITGDAARTAADDLARGVGGELSHGVGGSASRGIVDRLATGMGLAGTVTLVGGAAIAGGIATKMLLSPASAVPLGSDLDAYRQAVCDPESQYYDEASCQMVTDILRLIQTYPGSWEDVCIAGSPIYDPQACRAIQGMIAAAEKGVLYQGGDAEDYDGKTEIVDQNKIDELISRYCHPASSSYDPEACEKVKETARRYGFTITEPPGSSGGGGAGGGDGGGGGAGGGDAIIEEPPWDDLTLEEIHAIVCDRYGYWYDPTICKEYTDYLYSRRDEPSNGTEPHREDDPGAWVTEETDDGLYVSGRRDYAGVDGYFDGGWYGGGGGGVIYYDVPPGTEPVCHLEDETCIGWFEYVTEWFYWDGRNFYDTSGNLVYFVWTAADQAEYENLLMEITPDIAA